MVIARIAPHPKLTITSSPTPGSSVVQVKYTITFDKFDVASDCPYIEVIEMIGDDTALAQCSGRCHT